MEKFVVSHQIQKIIKIKQKIMNNKEKIILLIKWKNFDENYNSWEPLENLNFKSALISLKELKSNLKKKNDINSLILTNKAINIWKKNNNKIFSDSKNLKISSNLEFFKENIISINNSSHLNDSLLNIDVFSISDFFDNFNISKFKNKSKNLSEFKNLKLIYKNIISKKKKIFIEKDIYYEDSKKIFKKQIEISNEFDLIKKENKSEFFDCIFKYIKVYDNRVNRLKNEFYRFNTLEKNKTK